MATAADLPGVNTSNSNPFSSSSPYTSPPAPDGKQYTPIKQTPTTTTPTTTGGGGGGSSNRNKTPDVVSAGIVPPQPTLPYVSNNPIQNQLNQLPSNYPIASRSGGGVSVINSSPPLTNQPLPSGNTPMSSGAYISLPPTTNTGFYTPGFSGIWGGIKTSFLSIFKGKPSTASYTASLQAPIYSTDYSSLGSAPERREFAGGTKMDESFKQPNTYEDYQLAQIAPGKKVSELTPYEAQLYNDVRRGFTKETGAGTPTENKISIAIQKETNIRQQTLTLEERQKIAERVIKQESERLTTQKEAGVYVEDVAIAAGTAAASVASPGTALALGGGAIAIGAGLKDRRLGEKLFEAGILTAAVGVGGLSSEIPLGTKTMTRQEFMDKASTLEKQNFLQMEKELGQQRFLKVSGKIIDMGDDYTKVGIAKERAIPAAKENYQFIATTRKVTTPEEFKVIPGNFAVVTPGKEVGAFESVAPKTYQDISFYGVKNTKYAEAISGITIKDTTPIAGMGKVPTITQGATLGNLNKAKLGIFDEEVSGGAGSLTFKAGEEPLKDVRFVGISKETEQGFNVLGGTATKVKMTPEKILVRGKIEEYGTILKPSEPMDFFSRTTGGVKGLKSPFDIPEMTTTASKQAAKLATKEAQPIAVPSIMREFEKNIARTGTTTTAESILFPTIQTANILTNQKEDIKQTASYDTALKSEQIQRVKQIDSTAFIDSVNEALNFGTPQATRQGYRTELDTSTIQIPTTTTPSFNFNMPSLPLTPIFGGTLKGEFEEEMPKKKKKEKAKKYKPKRVADIGAVIMGQTMQIPRSKLRNKIKALDKKEYTGLELRPVINPID